MDIQRARGIAKQLVIEYEVFKDLAQAVEVAAEAEVLSKASEVRRAAAEVEYKKLVKDSEALEAKQVQAAQLYQDTIKDAAQKEQSLQAYYLQVTADLHGTYEAVEADLKADADAAAADHQDAVKAYAVEIAELEARKLDAQKALDALKRA
jgi:hypothetical protein